ncbi:hypothetical protein [Peribacillus frigoritolerans]|uniref:hypothetical protein n=1 Tax=Peribacillus frigoritolerans TaxID=450367 RepID=UPI003DA7085C
MSEAHHLRKHQDVKPKYPKRKETIKHVFADENESMVFVGILLGDLKYCRYRRCLFSLSI